MEATYNLSQLTIGQRPALSGRLRHLHLRKSNSFAFLGNTLDSQDTPRHGQTRHCLYPRSIKTPSNHSGESKVHFIGDFLSAFVAKFDLKKLRTRGWRTVLPGRCPQNRVQQEDVEKKRMGPAKILWTDWRLVQQSSICGFAESLLSTQIIVVHKLTLSGDLDVILLLLLLFESNAYSWFKGLSLY